MCVGIAMMFEEKYYGWICVVVSSILINGMVIFMYAIIVFKEMVWMFYVFVFLI